MGARAVWLRRFNRWLRDGGPVLVPILAFAWGSLVLFAAPHCVARASGLAFEWAGLLIAAWDVRARRLEFKPEASGFVRRWLRSFPKYPPEPIRVSFGAALEANSAMRARAHVSLRPTASLDEKVEFLVAQNRSLWDEIHALHDAGANAIDALAREEKARAAATEEATRRLASAMTAGLEWTVAGLVLVGLGVTLTTLR